MKTLLSILLIAGCIMSSAAQVVSNVNWELEGNEKIVITYDLAKQDTYIYFDVSVKVTIDKETITPKALSGDVGSFIKVGTGKKIVWNIFQDIAELNGELSVEVLAFNPVPTTATTKATKDNPDPKVKVPAMPGEKNVPFWVGMGGVGATGIGLMMNGLKGSGEGKDLYNIYKTNRQEDATVYTDLGSTRDNVYDEANKKYKNGTLMAAAGGAVLVAAGIIMVNRIIQLKKLKAKGITFMPYINVDPMQGYSKMNTNSGVRLKIKLR